VDLERLKKGGDFYAYDPALPPAWGIMPKRGTARDIRWFEVPRAFAGHIMNAFSEGELVHVDATISPGNPFTFFKDLHGQATDPAEGGAIITRVSFDLSSRNDNVALTPFPGAIGEMPKCDDRFQCKPYRWGWFKTPGGLGRLDWQTGEKVVMPTPDSPPGTQEPVFVPRSPDAAEGDGWLLALVNRFSENRADLLVIDAMAMETVATVRLPFNQPMAFHGMFVAS
jgi:carotenoid cleavage dioxygenase